MKKAFTILSALLIVTGLKAQKSNAQKETVKPPIDSLHKKGAVSGIGTDKGFKEAKIAPAQKEVQAIKYSPAIKKATPATIDKGFKETPVRN